MVQPKTEPDERPDPAEKQRNARLVILNGGTMQFAYSFASSEAIIPAYIQLLTGSSLLVGVSRAMMRIGWAWPQILISNLIEGRERKMPLSVRVGLGRAVDLVMISVATWLLAEEPPAILLGIFLLLYAVSTSLMGVTNVPWMDVMGKVIPSGNRARVFALRRLLGGSLAIGSGVVISYLLSDASRLVFPRGYAVLFMISGVFTWVAILLFGMIREPIENVARAREPNAVVPCEWLPPAAGRRGLPSPLHLALSLGGRYDGDYFLGSLRPDRSARFDRLYRTLRFGHAVQFDPFQRIWAWAGTRGGSRTLMIGGTYLLAASLAIPLLPPLVPAIPVRPLSVFGIDATFNSKVLFFSLTFLCNGFATSGMFTGRMALVLDLAPEDRRPTYTSFMNTLGVPQGLMPIMGGALASWLSFTHLFLIGLFFLPAAIFLAHRIQKKS